MSKSSIEWTDDSWNPIRGCTRVSPGCLNCYAETFAARFSDPAKDGKPAGHWHGFAKRTPSGGRWTGKVALIPEKMGEPLRWTRPRKIFVNSMSDLFHEEMPDEWIDQVFAVMALAQRHTFQVLTKRAKRMHAYLTEHAAGGRHVWAAAQAIPMPRGADKPDPAWPLPNCWLGVSAERQKEADERIPLLLQTPAAVRFVSYEPALGPVDFSRGFYCPPLHHMEGRCGYGKSCASPDWVIVGGESGNAARPFFPAWARQAVRQCKAAGTAVFLKQMGRNVIVQNDAGFEGDDPHEWPFGRLGRDTSDPGWIEHDIHGYREEHQGADVRLHLADKKGKDPNEWPRDLRVREFPREAPRG